MLKNWAQGGGKDEWLRRKSRSFSCYFNLWTWKWVPHFPAENLLTLHRPGSSLYWKRTKEFLKILNEKGGKLPGHVCGKIQFEFIFHVPGGSFLWLHKIRKLQFRSTRRTIFLTGWFIPAGRTNYRTTLSKILPE